MAEGLSAKGKDPTTIISHIQAHLAGMEIESFLAKLSQFFIDITLYPWIEKDGRRPIIPIAIGDALRHAPTLVGQFDAVICNPPYRKLPRSEVERLPVYLRHLCHMQPNLYGIFMALAMQLLNKKGIAGLLTPMSFLSGQSCLLLRRHLANTRRVARIDIVEEKLGIFLAWSRTPPSPCSHPKRT